LRLQIRKGKYFFHIYKYNLFLTKKQWVNRHLLYKFAIKTLTDKYWVSKYLEKELDEDFYNNDYYEMSDGFSEYD